jgi:hypothetical protein|tara:strand:+ start:948 stop:1139 length:192 start_codon:yes stop_codon:yes gene_type:complete
MFTVGKFREYTSDKSFNHPVDVTVDGKAVGEIKMRAGKGGISMEIKMPKAKEPRESRPRPRAK